MFELTPHFDPPAMTPSRLKAILGLEADPSMDEYLLSLYECGMISPGIIQVGLQGLSHDV